jgi:hypothetical protein
MNKLQIGFLSLATVITLTGVYEYFPRNTVKQVAADVSPAVLKERLDKNPLVFPSDFDSSHNVKYYIFPGLLIDNYQSPYFSNVNDSSAVRSVHLSATKTSGDDSLWNSLYIEVKVNEKDKQPQVVYSGQISGLKSVQILKPENYSLGTGLMEFIRTETWLPKTQVTDTPEKKVEWNFVITPN